MWVLYVIKYKKYINIIPLFNLFLGEVHLVHGAKNVSNADNVQCYMWTIEL